MQKFVWLWIFGVLVIALPADAAPRIQEAFYLPKNHVFTKGEVLEVRVKGESACKASFNIPGVRGEIPMAEVSPGTYRGQAVIGANLNLRGEYVEVILEKNGRRSTTTIDQPLAISTLEIKRQAAFLLPPNRPSVQPNRGPFVDSDQIPLFNTGPAPTTMVAWLQDFQSRIQKVWKAPILKNPSGAGVSTILVISLERSGSITGLKVQKSSGFKEVDDSLIATVKKVGPFYPLPPDLPEKNLDITFTGNVAVTPTIGTLADPKSAPASQDTDLEFAQLRLERCTLRPREMAQKATDYYGKYRSQPGAIFLIEARLDAGQWDKLSGEANQILNNHPLSREIILEQARLLYAQRYYPAALKVLGLFPELVSKDERLIYGFSFYKQQGNILFEMDQVNEALEAWDLALASLADGFDDARLRLVIAYLKEASLTPILKQNYVAAKKDKSQRCPNERIFFDTSGEKIKSLLRLLDRLTQDLEYQRWVLTTPHSLPQRPEQPLFATTPYPLLRQNPFISTRS